jgi:hypothetical protein
MSDIIAVPVEVDFLWGAVVYAQRKNTRFVNANKDEFESLVTAHSEHPIKQAAIKSNRNYVKFALECKPELITEEDIQKGREMRQYYQGLIFKSISNTLSKFERRLLSVVERTDWNGEYHLEFAILCSIPHSYYRYLERQE